MEKVPQIDSKIGGAPEAVSPGEKMRAYLKAEQAKVAEYFESKQEGVPEGEKLKIGPDFRIIPPVDLYTDDQKEVVSKKIKENFGNVSEAGLEKVENGKAGFLFEMLKTAVMHKKLSKDFVVVRASRYDDLGNGVDNVIVDKTSGETICALDEVSPRSTTVRDPEFVRKAGEVLQKNWGVNVANEQQFGSPQTAIGEQGAKLAYGIKYNEDGKISTEEMSNLPIFLLGLDHEHLDEGLRKFNVGGDASAYENELYDIFLSSITVQIKQLQLSESKYKKLPEDMRRRIESFVVFLKKEKFW